MAETLATFAAYGVLATRFYGPTSPITIAVVLVLFYTVLAMELSSKSVKGRAALSNAVGRFERYTRIDLEDGWCAHEDVTPSLRTEVREERARRIITRNTSPDLSFDRSVNPYRGCEHGCIYCFARPSHAYLGLSPGLDFETRLIARPNAAQLLEHELSASSYRVATLAMGTNTDPYQPVEKTLKITRGCLKVLLRARHPLALVTKGGLIKRDIDLLREMAQDDLVRVGISVTTLDPDVSRRMEPRVPGPTHRLRAIEELSAAGVPVRVMASPLVPGLTDHELERILQAGAEAGAQYASWIMLRLPREVSGLWQEWLVRHYPDRAGKVMARLREMHGGKDYDARWGHRMRGTGHYAELIAHRFKVAVRRTGLSEVAPDLRTDMFQPPKGQMSLL